MKKILAALAAIACFIALAGCAAVPPTQLDNSKYSTPSPGSAGVYFYRWKLGILGTARDVRFVLDGKELGQINTGEYLYFEVPAGLHKYRLTSGFMAKDLELLLDFREGQTYFFRGGYSNFTEYVHWINDAKEIDQNFAYIKDGTYERGDID